MSDHSKVPSAHLRRCALVYVRQSTTAQVEYNRESTERQYRLAKRAAELGWQRPQIKILNQDLAISGSGLAERTGFTRMTAEVAFGHVGIVLGLEVSRLARNNADWYRLLDLCGQPIPSSVMPTASIIRGCSMIAWYSDSRAPCQRPNCMCCVPASTAAFATRRLAVNCGADCPWD